MEPRSSQAPRARFWKYRQKVMDEDLYDWYTYPNLCYLR